MFVPEIIVGKKIYKDFMKRGEKSSIPPPKKKILYVQLLFKKFIFLL